MILSDKHRGVDTRFMLLYDIIWLILIWVDFSGVSFRVGGGKITPCLKLVRLCYKPDIWYVSTQIYLVSENIPFSTKTPSVLLIPASFCKNGIFLPIYYLYSKQWCKNCFREFLIMFFVFVRLKITNNENRSFTDYSSGIWLSDCSILVKN